jgi:hypothetical protein
MCIILNVFMYVLRFIIAILNLDILVSVALVIYY